MIKQMKYQQITRAIWLTSQSVDVMDNESEGETEIFKELPSWNNWTIPFWLFFGRWRIGLLRHNAWSGSRSPRLCGSLCSRHIRSGMVGCPGGTVAVGTRPGTADCIMSCRSYSIQLLKIMKRIKVADAWSLSDCIEKWYWDVYYEEYKTIGGDAVSYTWCHFRLLRPWTRIRRVAAWSAVRSNA